MNPFERINDNTIALFYSICMHSLSLLCNAYRDPPLDMNKCSRQKTLGSNILLPSIILCNSDNRVTHDLVVIGQ